ncbi:hypothetical protein B0H15DRAFT_971623 [Mycena belliarum]|uniref:Uncharacterized protein n=1 Tax=Mycena belliarum TaxID=1033014 RepID=A0AAD6TR68_9AGAR|nr:hypothetical protein B0H15DRAFT_971623 [Mycena belliae]
MKGIAAEDSSGSPAMKRRFEIKTKRLATPDTVDDNASITALASVDAREQLPGPRGQRTQGGGARRSRPRGLRSSALDVPRRLHPLAWPPLCASSILTLRQQYSRLFTRLSAQVAAGKFHPIGGSWVENDANDD